MKVLILILFATFGFSAGAVTCNDLLKLPQRTGSVEVIKNRTQYAIWDMDNDFGIRAELIREVLEVDIDLVDEKLGIRSPATIEMLFEAMMEHFERQEIYKISIQWSNGYDYVEFFNARKKRLSEEEAAFKTPTGQMAQKFGYTEVEVSVRGQAGDYQWVIAEFFKPGTRMPEITDTIH